MQKLTRAIKRLFGRLPPSENQAPPETRKPRPADTLEEIVNQLKIMNERLNQISKGK